MPGFGTTEVVGMTGEQRQKTIVTEYFREENEIAPLAGSLIVRSTVFGAQTVGRARDLQAALTDAGFNCNPPLNINPERAEFAHFVDKQDGKVQVTWGIEYPLPPHTVVPESFVRLAEMPETLERQ